ncbi:MAG TPA: helix-turn-helix transcriptional regulator, partial [Dehalococcoidia bacterium]|nr:helix-turn-helix transcriptional regulator [Dehalococcoidia bacterium]
MGESTRRTKEGYHWFRRWSRPSGSQRRVLDELLAGGTYAEIALRLGLSEESVRWHLNNVRSEVGLEDRAALVRWWRKERVAGSHNVLAFPMLFLRQLRDEAGPIAGFATLLAAAAGLTLLFLAALHGDGGQTEAHGGDGRLAFAPASVAIPAPTPTPSPVPAGAVVFNVQNGSTVVLPGEYTGRRWLDAEAMTFLAIGASGPLLIDAQGSARSLVANGSPRTVDAAPGIDGHSVYHFDYTTGRLEVLDAGGGEPRLLPPVTTGGRDRSIVALSAAGGRLAAVVDRNGGAELLLRDLEGGHETNAPLDAAASNYIIDWSPDGRHLLLVVYPANAPREANYRILDAPGNVVASGGGAPRWAGNDGLLFNVSVNNSPI